MRFSDYALNGHQVAFKHRQVTVGDYAGFYHYHRGIEVLYVHRGTGHVVLNSKMYALKPGSLMFVQPFQLHRVNFDVSPENPYERSVITFEPTTFYNAFQMFPSVRRGFERFWKDELPVQVFQTLEASEPASETRNRLQAGYLESLLDHYGPLFPKRSTADPEPVEAASLLLVALFEYLQRLDAGTETSTRIPRAESHAEKMMHWIEEHYAEPFELDALAKSLHLSKHHISHLFRHETGSSLTEYVIARRIRQACWLLKTGALPVEQIGAKVGIPNFSYFCRVFKKSTDMTPKEYRNQALLN